MAHGTFAAALKAVLGFEGGYVNNRHDPGGATNHGITQRVYDGWRRLKGLTPRPVREIDGSEVAALYREQYAAPIQFDALPAGVDIITFDGAVNSGVSRGAKWLQAAAGAAADGHIGPATLGRVARADPQALIRAIADRRLKFLRGLKIWRYFGKGWQRRVLQVRAMALMQAHLAVANDNVPVPATRPALAV